MPVKEIRSMAEFEALRASGKTFFIDCWATWCGPCRFISPIYEQISEEQTKENEVEFYKLDVDQVPDVAQALGVRAMPTFHAFKGEERLNSVVGAVPDALKKLIAANVPPA